MEGPDRWSLGIRKREWRVKEEGRKSRDPQQEPAGASRLLCLLPELLLQLVFRLDAPLHHPEEPMKELLSDPETSCPV